MNKINYWIIKSEPTEFSIDDLRLKPTRIEFWNGVRNYQARNFIRDVMLSGDLAFFYHSSCTEPGIVGIVQIVGDPVYDLSALDKDSIYFHPKSTKDNPIWYGFNIKYKRKFFRIIPLSRLRNEKALKSMLLLRTGNRLSIMPITQDEWHTILEIS